MRRTALRIGAELIPLLLVFACLGSALGLIVQAHRRSIASKVAKATEPKPAVVAPTPSAPTPPPVVAAPPPPEPLPTDPTETALAEIRTNLEEQIAEAKKADAEAARLDAARQSLKERTEGWKRRQMLAKAQLDRVDQAVSTLEKQADVLARMRDALAAKRDHEKVELATAKTHTGAAILPYKGANGTWRLPIVVECKNGTATLQPNGPSFSLLELSGVFSMRTSPIARAVALKLLEMQAIESPDGRAVVPYLLFVIRPDGIRPYYEARSRLEPLGITFGYELVDSDMDIEYPDLADVSEWSEIPGKKKMKSGTDGEFVWPAERPGFGGKGNDSEFIWPTQTQTAAAGTQGDADGGAENSIESAFAPQPRPGSTPYDGRKTQLDPLLGSGGHPGRPGYFDRGGLIPGEEGAGLGSPRNPGRVELTAEDLIAAAEEQLNGRGAGAYGAGESGAGVRDGAGAGGGIGREIHDPDPLAEPAPFPAGLGEYAQSAAGSPTGGSRAGPSEGLAASRGGAGGRNRAGTYPAGAQSKPGSGSIGRYGETFSPSAGLPPGTPGSNGIAGMPRMDENRASSVFDQTSRAGVATASGSGGGQGQGSKGNASPGLVGMSLEGATGDLNGKTDGPAGGGGQGEGGAEPSEAYRKRRNLDLTIACGPGGLVVHPGGYRLTLSSLDADSGMLDKVLHGIVRNHEKHDLKSDWMPRLKYLIEPGGQTAYAKARKQHITGASGWPARLQVTEGSPLRLAVEEKNTP